MKEKEREEFFKILGLSFLMVLFSIVFSLAALGVVFIPFGIDIQTALILFSFLFCMYFFVILFVLPIFVKGVKNKW